MRWPSCVLFGLLLSLAACGGPPPTPTTPSADNGDADQVAADAVEATPGQGESDAPAARVAAPSDGKSLARSQFDTSAVTPPGEVVLHLRWRNPSATVGTLAQFGKIPRSVVDKQLRAGLKEIFADELRDLVDPTALAEAVAIDAPLDAVMTVDTKGMQPIPKPMGAFALGLNSLERAKGAVRSRLEDAGSGIWKLSGGKPWGPQCVIAAAAGKAPARLICADDERQLESIAPFMARNVPMLPDADGDITLKLTMRALLDKYGRKLAQQAKGLPSLAKSEATGIAKLDNALVEAAEAIADEAEALIADLDSAELALKVDANRGITLQGNLRFAGKRSWIAQTAMDGASLAGPAPKIFWHAPMGGTTTMFDQGGDSSRIDPILKSLGAMAEALMEDEKFATRGDRAAITKLLRIPIGKNVAAVTVTGRVPPKPNAQPDPIALMLDSVGWYLVGVEEGPAQLRAYLNQAVRTYNRPTLKAALKKELGSDAKHLPIVKTTRAPASLGAGALAIEISVPNLDGISGKKLDVRGHLLMMADGDRTWLGFALDRDALAKLMVSAKTTGPATISARNDISVFKSGRHTSGGFMTFSSMIEAMKPGMMMAMTMGSDDELEKVMQALEQLPHKGKTPILFLGSAQDGARPTVNFSAVVQRGTLEDAGWLVTQYLTLKP